MQSGLESLSDKHLYLAIKQARKEEFDYHCAYCGVNEIIRSAMPISLWDDLAKRVENLEEKVLKLEEK
jgi:hypothetical protein